MSDNKADHLELGQIDGLIAAAGADGAREIVAAFHRSTLDLIEQISAHLQQGALDLAASAAHAVKGSAANVGAVRVAEAAAHLEVMCKEQNHDASGEALNTVRGHFEAANNHLTEHIEANGR
ncbi:MAG: Hpt domain-containing protein [Marinicaulis sp.]|nr:Hpt domain-containing protein [Marinicaulis sp.]NNE40410.1 Hpt domain-containing protein [Marinicaulis sp.]NNL89762.1 Hpt domain-containing protein [Marinicaulis sp.]